MQVDNVKITINIHVHFNHSDKNGYVYIKKACKEAVKNAVNIPIEIIHGVGTHTAVGVAQDVQLVKDDVLDIIKVLECVDMVVLLMK